MVSLLSNHPLLLLFLVIAIGYPLGRIRIAGTQVGLSAVLFAGIAVSAVHPSLKLPELVYQLGLVLFVYTVGLACGHGFFASFQRKGLRDNLLVVGVLAVGTLMTASIHYALHLRPATTAGMFSGSLTNTPALVAVLETIERTAPPETRGIALADPVVGYSVAYPFGVVGMLLVIAILQRLWKPDYDGEARAMPHLNAASERLTHSTLRVARPDASGSSLDELARRHGWDVIFGRCRHEGSVSIATGQTRLAVGDLVTVVGTAAAIARVVDVLGETSDVQIDLDRSRLDYRRIFVSNRQIVGHRLDDLNLPQTLGAVVTRVRRGDVEMLPHGDTVLQLGDRVRVVSPREQMDQVTKFFGDSYRALSEVDVLPFSVGISLGLLLGLVPIPFPGGLTLTLGLAGGPLVLALVLGALGRTGPVVWTLPFNVNLTLRQLGLVLFLAGVGTRSGYAFIDTVTRLSGLAIFLGGAIITAVAALLLLWIAHKLFKIPMGLAIGMLAGLQTNPAVLNFAQNQAGNDLPNIGYATVYPMAMIAKIVLAQLLLGLLSR